MILALAREITVCDVSGSGGYNLTFCAKNSQKRLAASIGES